VRLERTVIWRRRIAAVSAILLLVVAVLVLVLAVGADGAGSGYNPSPISSKLTPLQLAGQRVIYSYQGTTPPASLVQAIRRGEAAGVVFFGGNISSPAQLDTVARRLQSAARQSPVKLPLLLMTDQEGGQVRRLPGAPIYSEKQIGESADPASAARRAGRGAGLNLRKGGLNVNLAPVLDVYRQAGNFIDQFGRSYSRNPRVVATLGADFITKQQQVNVAATAKHFPGLGAASRAQDTDSVPVTLNLSRSQIRDVDELPYRSAIAAHTDLVMVSWARYPALDAKYPAGLSARIIQGELRDRLRFRGVTITDALEAGALKAFGGTSERAFLAARAGMDLILCASKSVGQGAAADKALANALTSRHLARSAFLIEVNRILQLRHSLEG
jgi:beta-N-acetylhexosaminidase